MSSAAAVTSGTRDWGRNREMWVRALESRTGKGVAEWMSRIEKARVADERGLRGWLKKQGVTGYGQQLLVMERFGYPDFVLASARELIDAQYEDRPALRPIYDAVVRAAQKLGDVAIQARKSYVSLVTPRRTFARVQATTRTRVDLALRLSGQIPAGRLQRSRIHETMPVQVCLESLADFDRDAQGLLLRAYRENC